MGWLVGGGKEELRVQDGVDLGLGRDGPGRLCVVATARRTWWIALPYPSSGASRGLKADQ